MRINLKSALSYMKNKFKLFICLVILTIQFDLNINAQILEYSFDYEPNNIISDVGILNNHARIIGAPNYVSDRNGNDCRALYFDGKTYLTILNHPSLNFKSEFSVSVWLKLEDDELDWITLLCKGNNPFEDINSPSYRVQLTNVTASFNTASTKQIGNKNQSFENNKWFHLVTTFTYNEAAVYVNGNKSAHYYINAPLGFNNSDLEIGRDVPGITEYFIGTMDELKIFDKVLDDVEIKKIFNQSNAFNSSACQLTTKQSKVQSSIEVDWDDFKDSDNSNKIDPSLQIFTKPTSKNEFDINWDDFENFQEEDTIIANDWNDFSPISPKIDINSVDTPKILKINLNDIDTADKKLIKQLNIKDKFITNFNVLNITLHDHKRIDKDSINVYLNNSLIVENYELKPITDKTVLQFPIEFLNANQSIFLSLEALNFGNTGVPLNTVAISINDGKNTVLKEFNIKKLNEKVTLEFIFKP